MQRSGTRSSPLQTLTDIKIMKHVPLNIDAVIKNGSGSYGSQSFSINGNEWKIVSNKKRPPH